MQIKSVLDDAVEMASRSLDYIIGLNAEVERKIYIALQGTTTLNEKRRIISSKANILLMSAAMGLMLFGCTDKSVIRSENLDVDDGISSSDIDSDDESEVIDSPVKLIESGFDDMEFYAKFELGEIVSAQASLEFRDKFGNSLDGSTIQNLLLTSENNIVQQREGIPSNAVEGVVTLSNPATAEIIGVFSVFRSGPTLPPRP